MTPLLRLCILSLVCACATAQYAEERQARYIDSDNKVAPTPVPILKQINRHNEDGSYTYGYEAADGSFKIETKSPTGEVKGKYGYKDDSGKVRVVEYGANKYGFQPAGEGITVAPPTLVDETREERERQGGKGQQAPRSQFRAQPAQQAVDYDYEEPAPPPRPRPAPRPAPQPQQYRPAPPPPQQYRPAPQSAPTPPKPQFFAGAAPAPVEQGQFFSPAPQQRQQQYRPPKQPDFRPAPAPSQFNQDFGPPQQNFAPAPRAEPRFTPAQQFNQPRNQPFSMLDQLLNDPQYALPQGGAAPLHDITFGSY